ncbi:MAG: peptidoglycan DD-metalloendopeptidase family protein [Myxococcota bacterium]|nr:peptidoglycan DD-metalloendopeptidase family protein [Myxococcota bacterium]MEE2779778.1 peptidoglycan DD-metalloendopeptidase family protein [Myxococcota bacterium]
MKLDKPILLRSERRRRQTATGSRGSAVLVVMVLGLLNYVLFFQSSPEISSPTMDQRLQGPGMAPNTPAADTVPGNNAVPNSRPGYDSAPLLDDFGQPIGRTFAGTLKPGHTILKALQQEGIGLQTAQPVVRSMGEVFDFRQAQAGDTFEGLIDDDGHVRRFRYEQSPLDIYEVVSGLTGDYHAEKVQVPTRVEIARLGCAIKRSLYESMARCGEGHQLGALFIDLFAWDVDFFQDVRQGDEFRVIVEKVSVDGKFLKYGRILAADYEGKFGAHRIVYYSDPDGHSGYYETSGTAVRKDFLRSPMKYTRVSSKGTSAVRQSLKKPSPLVYTAPVDTPVWAVASGTVTHVLANGPRGYSVTVKHENGYKSKYSYMGRLSQRVKVGDLVTQKTVLGYMGKTGKTSEPKLVFSLRRNGELLNPLQQKFSEGDPVPEEHRSHFEDNLQDRLRDLEATTVIGVHERRS